MTKAIRIEKHQYQGASQSKYISLTSNGMLARQLKESLWEVIWKNEDQYYCGNVDVKDVENQVFVDDHTNIIDFCTASQVGWSEYSQSPAPVRLQYIKDYYGDDFHETISSLVEGEIVIFNETEIMQKTRTYVNEAC